MGWIIAAIVMALALVGISVWKNAHTAKLERMRVQGKRNNMSEQEIGELVSAETFPLPKWASRTVVTAMFLFIGLGLFNKVFFYAEPGFVYHVRTITGEERVIDSVGYSYHLFGRINDWKKALTVQAVAFIDSDGDGNPDVVTAEDESSNGNTSANLPPLSVVMLDQVDSKISATVRYRIPTEKEAFLKMAHEYRNPDNLLVTALIPAFKETLQATGSLMAAEEYYSGRRTEFNAEFENQMQNGIYLVSRHQVVVSDPAAQAKGSAAADLGADQADFGTANKIKFVVEKKLRSDGSYERKPQNFTDYGIQVIEARVTDLVPNRKFVERMQLKQQAAADRAIAQEKRVQEEEQRLLAIAKGDREVAEQQAEAKKVQIKQTTEAETSKRLALINAAKQLEQAEIDKQTAQIQKEKADIDAERIKVLADADKYEREARIAGDNALQQKLDTELAIQKVWAEAYKERKVPQIVFAGTGGTGSGDSAPVGADTEVKHFLQMMTIEAAKNLSYNRGLQEEGVGGSK